MSATFAPIQAMIGGAFIGAACGMYMIFAGRVAGNSGALKAFVKSGFQAETTKITFLAGLISGGVIMGSVLPSAFEAAPEPSIRLALAGLSVGLGVSFGNGCTSGHGLCGLSRLSLRSLAAVPTFMGVAIAAATAWSGSTSFGGFVPMSATPDSVLTLSKQLGLALAAALVPLALLPTKSTMYEAYAGLWSGLCFAVGLSIGGMVRPSVVTSALSPAQVDLTLWVLFVTALVVTFGCYRVAEHALGVREASAVPTKPGGSQPRPDSKLLLGASLFGLGWGSSGLCPGPHLVSLAAAPVTSAGGWVMLAGVAIGMNVARAFGA